eukprot:UN30999
MKSDQTNMNEYKEKYQNEDWFDRYHGKSKSSLGKGIIVACHSKSGIKSFIVGYEVNENIYPGIGQGIYFHIWMAGTVAEYRGQGLMRKCFELLTTKILGKKKT